MSRSTNLHRRIFWVCCACRAQNHVSDGECQYCECGGIECKRDNCSTLDHFHRDHTFERPVPGCTLCEAVWDQEHGWRTRGQAIAQEKMREEFRASHPEYFAIPGSEAVSLLSDRAIAAASASAGARVDGKTWNPIVQEDLVAYRAEQRRNGGGK